jgi:hypothetical protein
LGENGCAIFPHLNALMLSIESRKAVLSLLFIICAVAAVIAWVGYISGGLPKPGAVTWTVRIVGTPGALLFLWILLRLHLKRDEVPDFLSSHCDRFFERNGFCFALAAEERDGIGYITLIYQNRYSNPCRASVVAHPRRGKLPSIGFNVDCPPAGFGFIQAPRAIPIGLQGQTVRFDVGASVKHPEGRGRLLRRRDGIPVGDATLSLVPRLIMASAAAWAGQLLVTRSASTKITLPRGVVDELDEDIPVVAEVVWALPPIAEAGEAAVEGGVRRRR